MRDGETLERSIPHPNLRGKPCAPEPPRNARAGPRDSIESKLELHSPDKRRHVKICPQCQMRYPPDAGKFCFVDGAVLGVMQDPRIGSTIAGRYVIDENIGEGGMATVYRARHKLIDRPCAIKILAPQMARDAVVRERFRREAKSAQSLAHPNIIEIYDQGDTDDGTAYIVMELLHGSSLADVIAKGPISFEVAIPLMIQMSRGIARAHDLGVIHRDLKPENTFVCKRPGSPELVKLLDFGIARSRTDSRLTSAGELFGTPHYMAPERVQSGDAGPSVDLYALGVIFFEMVTGVLPFDAPDATTFLIRHVTEKPKSPRALNPEIPLPLEDLILRLLEKDPKARPVDAHRVESDLTAIAGTLGIPLPRDEANDPASSRPPARTLPAVGVDKWSQRTRVFEQMLARAFSGSPPKDLTRMLDEVSQLVVRVTDLRGAAVKDQRTLEEIDQRGRDGRQRFGFAVDALGVDASKAKDEVRGAQALRAEAKQHAQAAAARFALVHRDVIIWEGRSGFHEPYAELAEAYRKSTTAVEEWLAMRKEEARAQRSLEEHERIASDLEYQIRELRGALANYEKQIDTEHNASEKKIIEMNQQAETMEASLLQLASKFTEPLRTRPELGPLFQQLESDAAA